MVISLGRFDTWIWYGGITYLRNLFNNYTKSDVEILEKEYENIYVCEPTKNGSEEK